MGDPQSLYIVTSVVGLGLLTWVAAMLLRSDKEPPAPRVRSTAPQGGDAQRLAGDREAAGEEPGKRRPGTET
jgi:hypothetical protein